jgi:hypothetical protein
VVNSVGMLIIGLILMSLCFNVVSFNFRPLLVERRGTWRLVTKDDEESERLMSVDEIKAELDLRSVDYIDCTTREDLISCLRQSRVTGKANPKIFETFTKQTYSSNKIHIEDVDDDLVDKVKSIDESIYDSFPFEILKTFASDMEIIQLYRESKLQDIMKAVMTGGPDAMKPYMSDPDAMLLLQKLSQAMQRVHTTEH